MSMKLYSNATSRLGTELLPSDRAYVLAAYCHRYTGNHKPAWALQPRPDGTSYPLQFASDAEWLANTRFEVGAHGDLDRRANSCLSAPTWPNNPELRKVNAPLHPPMVITAAAYWAPYLVNGDRGDLSTSELRIIAAWLEREQVHITGVVPDCEEYFTWSARLHCPELGVAGMVALDYTAEDLSVKIRAVS